MTPAVTFARTLAPQSIALALGLGALEGCTPTAPTTSYTPVTGIEIPSADIVAGHGCGNRAPDQVYKYAALVTYGDAGCGGNANGGGDTSMSPVASGVFDCFADGVFSNLPQSDAGSSSFVISIYGYNQCSFASDVAWEDPNAVTQSVAASPANWTATCAGTQIPGVTTIACCSELQAQADAPPCADAGTE
jgi:hypothetical protein